MSRVAVKSYRCRYRLSLSTLHAAYIGAHDGKRSQTRLAIVDCSLAEPRGHGTGHDGRFFLVIRPATAASGSRQQSIRRNCRVPDSAGHIFCWTPADSDRDLLWETQAIKGWR